MGEAARRDGLRLRDELLATAGRLAGGRGLGRLAPPAAGAVAGCGADRLAAGRAGQCHCSGKKGGAETGPNPTDRGKPGTKRHLVTDTRGTPLGLKLTGANRHDSPLLSPTLDAIPPLPRPCAGVVAVRGSGRASCMPTRPTMPAAAGRSAASTASSPASPAGHREQRTPGPAPLGARAYPRLVQPLPPAGRTLQTPLRQPPRLHHSRRPHHTQPH